MKTLCSAVALLFLHQVFSTSAIVLQMYNASESWMDFRAQLEKVEFRDGQQDYAAVCNDNPGAQMNGGCCSTSDYIPINPTKRYEFSIYIKSTSFDTVNSFGFYVYNETKGRILNPNLNDPYFKNSGNDTNEWTKWTGYILPSYMSVSDSDSQPDSQFYETIRKDWKWPRHARYVALRFGSCGSHSETGIVRRDAIATPTFDPLDGSMTTGYEEHTPPASPSGVEIALQKDATSDPGQSPTTTESSTAPPTPQPPTTPPSTTSPDKTWYIEFECIESETPLQPGHVGVWTFNISDFHEWDAKPNYTGNGYVNEHDIHTPIAKIVEGKGRKCYYPWGITHRFEIDSNKAYEFSVWILSTQTDLHNFLGFRAYDENEKLLTFPLDKKGDDLQYYSNHTSKPYFKRSNNDTTEWTRWNGFVLPDGADDIPRYFSKGRTWVWPRRAKYAQLRFGTCYGDGNDQGITYFALPRMVQTDFQP